ncbi:hypothetical protein ACFL04_00270 [Patescibacteria group bacterium]
MDPTYFIEAVLLVAALVIVVIVGLSVGDAVLPVLGRALGKALDSVWPHVERFMGAKKHRPRRSR